jgi:hypothetical protein
MKFHQNQMPANECCTQEPLICLYTPIADISAALGSSCALTDGEIENIILGVMCDIDAYVGRTEKLYADQEFNFPRLCDSDCIPFKIKMVATELAIAAAKKECSGGSSCGLSVDPAEIKSETILGHSYTKFDKTSNSFSSIPERLQKRLDDFKMRSGYLEVDVYQRQPMSCCRRKSGPRDQCCPGVQ